MRAAMVFLALFLLAGRASAEGPDMTAAIREALAWLAANSRYTAVVPPRSYAMLDREEMRARAVNLASADNAAAIYSCPSQTVFLRDTFNPAAVWDMAVLVHEITHHAQCATRRSLIARCEMEREAYDMQLRYLEQRAITGRERLPELRRRFDEIVASHCRS